MANNSSVFTSWEHMTIIDLCVGMETGIYIWGICSMICCVVGFPASVAILWEMYKAYRDKVPVTSTNLFILNLSIMDAIFLFSLPMTVASVFKFNISLIVSLSDALYALNLCGRPLMMACICLDFYLAVVHPMFYRRMKGMTPRAVGVAGVWTVTLISAGIYFQYPWLYLTYFSTMYYIIAMVLICIFDGLILRALVAPVKGRKGVHPQKKKAIHIVTNSLAMVVISYLPPTVFFLFGLGLMADKRKFLCIIGVPIALTSTLGSAMMPVLYLGNIGKLQCIRQRCCQWQG